MNPIAQSRQASSKLAALTPCTKREDECTVFTALGIVLVLVMFATAYVVMP